MTEPSEVPVDILVIEDNPGDVRLIKEIFKVSKISVNLAVAKDGQEAMHFLNHECKQTDRNRPKLIILDLNLPKKSGNEVLKEIKADSELKKIPVVILTTSSEVKDVTKSYNNHANAFLTKPVDLDQFINVIKSIQEFWIEKAKLP